MRRITVIVVLLAELGAICWYGGYVAGRPRADRAATAARSARASEQAAELQEEHAANEIQRLHLLSVNFVRFTDRKLAGDSWEQVEFKVTNETGRTINEADGRIRLYNSSHHLLGVAYAHIVEPLSPGGSATKRTRWTPLDDAVRSALLSGEFTADYQAARVYYEDGATQKFGFISTDSQFLPGPVSD